jgi:hypothetical protein
VEQAYALSKYEVDTLEKYDNVFGGPEDARSSFSRRLNESQVSDIKRDRILRHHAKILAAKKRPGVNPPLSPSPQLVASLRRIYERVDKGEEGRDSSGLKTVLQSVTSHPVFSKEEGSKPGGPTATSKTPKSTAPKANESSSSEPEVENRSSSTSTDFPKEGFLEVTAVSSVEYLIAQLYDEGPTKTTETPSSSSNRDSKESVLEDGLLIAALSILTEYEVTVEEEPKAGLKAFNSQRQQKKENHDPTVVPSLQVGAILSLLRTSEKVAPSLESDTIAYLGDAAAVYEERIEIQKARLLNRLEASSSTPRVTTPTATSLDYVTGESSLATFSTPSLSTIPTHAHDSDSVSSPPVATLLPSERSSIPAARISIEAAISFRQTEIESSYAALNEAIFDDILTSADDIVAGENDTGGDTEDHTGDDADDQLEDGMVEEIDSDSESAQEERNAIQLNHEDGEDEDDNDGADENDSSSSSSSDSSISGGGPGEDDQESDDGDIEGDDADVVRQALALSAVDRPESTPRLELSQAFEENAPAPSSDDAISGPVTPGNQTPLSESEGNANNDESPLPPIPPPPKSNPYASLLLDLSADEDSDHVQTAESSFFDPSALHRFGAIPASHVMIHLLKYLCERIERRKILIAYDGASPSHKERSRATAIPGGMGFALFPPNYPSVRSKSSMDNGNDITISFQLLITLLLLSVDKRNDAIENLTKAVAQEKRVGQEGKARNDYVGPGGDEGDDPAIAMALTYIDDDVSEPKESLEGKGMRRKAAAAAHDAAALFESLQKRTNAWRIQVKMFSQCCLLSMKCLRHFLQYLVKRWLRDRHGVAPSDFNNLLPTAVVSKLSTCLETLSSINAINSYSTILNDSGNIDLERFVIPMRLYQESIWLWGECVAIFYPSVITQEKVLRSLLSECGKTSTIKQHQPLENLSSIPISDSEVQFHRLIVLSRRLRVSDLLDRFVSSPSCYLPESQEPDFDSFERNKGSDEPYCVSSLIECIGAASRDQGGLKGDLQYLYLSLCHRLHSRILLWDGLFACSDAELVDPVASLTSSAGESAVCLTPSTKLYFDATKCSDSMAIIATQDVASPSGQSSSVHQRASKVWGTVLSSTCFSPKTGIHRWAVRLDKCERGHVFVGVSTAQASIRTYVGGDKYGWGMIGTQALWHDRRKIRGDYGATFRTGSTIIVTLDTDAGTLSFSSWKDSSTLSSHSLDQVVQSISSPRQQSHQGGSVEEWGVAFEGLPLDSKLYPAVGLYQRDDRVTLLAVESGAPSGSNGFGSVDMSGGLCFYPRIDNSNRMDSDQRLRMQKVRRFNDLLLLEGVRYLTETLQRVVSAIEGGQDDFLCRCLLPSLTSAVCLIPPNLPVLSQRFAMALLPPIRKSIMKIEKPIEGISDFQSLFQSGVREGKWIIRATGSSGAGSDSEEYLVDVSSTTESGSPLGFQGKGVGTTGKSKNGLVTIFGTVIGSSVHFVEEWTDAGPENFNSWTSDDAASSCVVTARLSLDGKKFEGTYRNVQFGTAGQIAGFFAEDDEFQISMFSLKEGPKAPSEKSTDSSFEFSPTNALLGLAHAHLTTIVGEDPADDSSNEFDQSTVISHVQKDRLAELLKCLETSTIAESSTRCNHASISKFLEAMKEAYFSSSSKADTFVPEFLTPMALNEFDDTDANDETSLDVEKTLELIRQVDSSIASRCGGIGSLASLCPSEYQRSRLLLICAFLHHCNVSVDGGSSFDLESIWTFSLKLVEDGVRRAVSKEGEGSIRSKAVNYCQLFMQISEFLLDLDSSTIHGVGEVSRDFALIFSVISCQDDLKFLQKEVVRSSRKAFLRLVAIRETINLLDAAGSNSVLAESLATAIPRLLGRGLSEGGRHQIDVARAGELGRHYLSNIPGAASRLRKALRGAVHRLFVVMSDVAMRGLSKTKHTSDSAVVTTVDSMTLALVAGLTTVLRNDDVQALVLKSQALPLINGILSDHRHVLNRPVKPDFLGSDKCTIAEEIHEIGRMELSRALLGVTVALSHVVFFQAWSVPDANNYERHESSFACLKIIWTELMTLHPILLETINNSMKHMKHNQSSLQWDVFCTHSLKVESLRTPTDKIVRKVRQVGRSGISYLRENGTFQVTLVPTSLQKSSSARKSLQNGNLRQVLENPITSIGVFCHNLFSHWLCILLAATKTPVARELIVTQPDWIVTLFHIVGIDLEYDESQGIFVSKCEEENDQQRIQVPGRYRCRLLRVLRSLLEVMQPSVAIANSLFRLAGSSSTPITLSLDEDEAKVSREAVSLLRYLHSPCRSLWRDSINSAMKSTVENSQTDVTNFEKFGVLCFLNGDFEGIGKGSFVLLKPAAAVPLSPEQQGHSSSKSHSSSGGSTTTSGSTSTPHHIVGNGTESVVAGLCRFEAPAGIVTSIDLKNGACEVILLGRNNRFLASGSIESVNDNVAFATGSGSENSQTLLTIRAFRSALIDVVQAQEVPIHLDQSIPVDCIVPGLLKMAIATLNETRCIRKLDIEKNADSDETKSVHGFSENRSRFLNVFEALMSLKSCITLLSDEDSTSMYLKDQKMQTTLSEVLRLAYPDDWSSSEKDDSMKSAGQRFMSSFPMHEARLVHITNLFRRLDFEATALAGTSGNSWKTRLESLSDKFSESQSEATDLAEMAVDRVFTNPQPDSSAVSSTRSFRSVDGTDNTSARRESTTSRAVSQSTVGSDNSEEDDEESEAAAMAAAHLREAAIAQMAELGLPRSWSELALRRTGGTNIEAAVHFCLERGGEMERLLGEERERERMMQRQAPGGAPRIRRVNRAEATNHLLRQLMEMGFPSRWCAEALTATGNNVDEALTWILTNGERLSAEDEGIDEGGDDDDVDEAADDDDDENDDDDEEEDSQATEDRHSLSASDAEKTGNEKDIMVEKLVESAACLEGWSGSIIPLRFISGRANVDSKTLAISGLPSGGFSSVGTKGVMLTSGKWYYEAVLETAGCLQIGWADGSFAGHCHADRGDGCGDGPSSWAYDGWRRYRWHSMATEWGCRWSEGDVIGCLVDMDDHIVSFTMNGKAEEVGMGVAFSGQGFRPCGGVYACVSFNRREKLRLILGGSGSAPFNYAPPDGYRGVGEAVLDAVKEREHLALKEAVLGVTPDAGSGATFLCDFSDGEHGHELMAWAHRYYGSDASVHLGSGRLKPSNNFPKNSFSSHSQENTVSQSVFQRIEKEWTNGIALDIYGAGEKAVDKSELENLMMAGLIRAGSKMCQESVSEMMILSSLAARKLLLHVVISSGSAFDPDCVLASDENKQDSAVRFWNMIEACTALRSAGWIGEAGAMAIAAEALGLGISSNESSLSRMSSLERSGVVSVSDLDEGVLLPTGAGIQLLNSVLFGEGKSTGNSFAASAEFAISCDGGGVLVFLQRGLQAAVCKSVEIRSVVLASVRRSVRLLAVVEYDDDDWSHSHESGEEEVEKSIHSKPRKGRDEKDSYLQPDARLTCWTSGLLLSSPVANAVDNFVEIQSDLFEAWSVGLLSASLPWRMICAFTSAGILNLLPSALISVVRSLPTIGRYFARLRGTVARRVWGERAAMPVCSRYSQAMVELLCSVTRAVDSVNLPPSFYVHWNLESVDAATPLALPNRKELQVSDWEVEDGWVSSDRGWEIWTGTVEVLEVDWKTPTRSAVRSLMEGGDGPPMLREGCMVMRGLDWEEAKNDNDDGKDEYELQKKKRDEEKRSREGVPETTLEIDPATDKADTSEEPAEESQSGDHKPDLAVSDDDAALSDNSRKNKKKKIASPKLPVGVVISIEPWDGVPAMARRVRWHLTGIEKVYRYGGDGGRYDLSHVEVNEKATRVRKRYPLPESAEQCAARHGFGMAKRHSILLRLKRCANIDVAVEVGNGINVEGIMEWPEFGAGILVDCLLKPCGSVVLQEKDLLYGSKDSGWEARFGQPSYVPNTTVTLNPTSSDESFRQADVDAKSPFQSLFQELVGNCTHHVENLRNRENGGKVHVTSKFCIKRSRCSISDGSRASSESLVEAPMPPPIHFDPDYHASSLSLSRDGRTVSCISSDGRGTAYTNMGFSKGVHYWEVKLEQADIGSVFVGVAEKTHANGSSSSLGYDSPPRLNRWQGWGFVNFRATYTAGAERIYGAHCHAGDTIGVMLDCDAGRISFFFDGLKYGEHILNDLGCAFENLSPFGFNVDGCGSGGAGQGAPSGIEGGRSGRYPAQGLVRPRALWPVIGLRNHGDRVTISSKWSSSYGVDSFATLRNILAVDDVLHRYSKISKESESTTMSNLETLPRWFVIEAFGEFKRWNSRRWCRSITRGSGPYRLASFGLETDLDSSPLACAAACALLGLSRTLLPGDRVSLKRSAGKILELAEEAVVLGTFQGRLYYRIVSQKSEGGSLTEGGGRSWFWDESEVVDGLETIGTPKGLDVELPLMDRFKCTSSGGLKIVYEGGAVIRSDLEIFDGSVNLGTIPYGGVIPKLDILERRVNSCGVVRYRARFESLEGWISSSIRGGKEEPIVMPLYLPVCVDDDDQGKSFVTPRECADEWLKLFSGKESRQNDFVRFDIDCVESFERSASTGVIGGFSPAQSDAFLAATVGKICSFCEGGNPLDAPFDQVASALGFALASSQGQSMPTFLCSSLDANQVAATAFESLGVRKLPCLESIMARIALLRAFNRRARVALPWISLRPCQEGAAMLGGIYGLGTSIDRAGRYSNRELLCQWVEVPSMASALRGIRGLFFTSVKQQLLNSITDVTTTPTPLAHDEYELPREIRTVRINRLKARLVMGGDEVEAKRKYGVFAQLQNETKAWGGAALRRGFAAKGHGGQRRAFKVKLIGEGVNDYSGPYREAFADALSEILDVDKRGNGSLGVLDPTPNNVSAIGENRDLFMFSLNSKTIASLAKPAVPIPFQEKSIQSIFSSLVVTRDEATREVEEALVFLGRLTGTAFRHGIQLNLPLPMESVWKAMVEEGGKGDLYGLQELDILAYRQLPENKNNSKSDLLCWQQTMLNSFVDGLSSVLPVEIFPILTGEELREFICGNPEIDVEMLRRIVEYEGFEETDPVIQFFWETLREFTNDERKSFLRFVWARNRLPSKESDFDAPFKIQKDNNSSNDQALPSASTCFFSLALPPYKTKEQLKDKLLFAINNVTTMETDFQTNSAEIAEGYRSF